VRGSDQAVGAGDLRQIERDRAIAPRRQQPPDAKRSATPSPAKAVSTSLRVSASAAPSSKVSIAMVVLFRVPFGRPLGLPPEGGARAAGLRSSMVVSSSSFGRVAGPERAMRQPASRPRGNDSSRRRALAPRWRGDDAVESGAILSSTDMMSTSFMSIGVGAETRFFGTDRNPARSITTLTRYLVVCERSKPLQRLTMGVTDCRRVFRDVCQSEASGALR
jgi:hypothetical protein